MSKDAQNVLYLILVVIALQAAAFIPVVGTVFGATALDLGIIISFAVFFAGASLVSSLIAGGIYLLFVYLNGLFPQFGMHIWGLMLALNLLIISGAVFVSEYCINRNVSEARRIALRSIGWIIGSYIISMVVLFARIIAISQPNRY